MVMSAANTDHDKKVIKRQIDRLVYNLYGLTDQDIRIVEESTK